MPLASVTAHLKQACRIGLVIAAALGLAACYDIETRLAINPDATAKADFRLRFDADMQEMFSFIEAMAQLKAEGALVKDGLCNAIGILGQMSPMPDVAIDGKQFKEGDRFYCQASAAVKDVKLLETKGEISQFFEIKPEGPKRYRIEAKLNAIPDLSPMLMELMTKDLPPNEKPDPAKSNSLYQKYVSATLALTRITMRDRYVDMSISAPRIVESNGVISPDKKSVSFRYTAEEFTKLMLDAKTRQGKNLFAVVEY
jgi:hypothetical protein